MSTRDTDTAKNAETAGTTAIEADDGDTGGTLWDAPNQQVVRPDQSAPWEEGTGGQAIPKDDPATTTARRSTRTETETATRTEPATTEPASE